MTDALLGIGIDLKSEGAQSAIEELLGGFEKLAGPAAIGAVAVGLGALVADSLSAADEIDQLTTRTGLSAEELQILGNIAAQSGGEMEDVADAAREMQLRLAEAASLGSGPAVDALRLLNLTLDDFAGLGVDERFALLRDRISEVVDPAERLFVAEELLGGSTERLNGLLSVSNDEFGRLRTTIGETGIFTAQEVEDLNDAHDALANLRNQVTGLKGALAAELAPAIEVTSNFLTRMVDAELPVFNDQLVAAKQFLADLPGPFGAVTRAITGFEQSTSDYVRTSGRTVETVGAATRAIEAHTGATNADIAALESHTVAIAANAAVLRDQADAARLAAAQIREAKIQAGDLATTLDFYGDLYGIGDVTGAGSVQRGNDLQALTTGGTATEEETTADVRGGYGGNVL